MEDNRFDELARRVSEPISRRQAFKAVLVTAVGGLLVRAESGAAYADGGNSDCAHFCDNTYPPGPDRGQCKSDAAHGVGTCATCGPTAPAAHPDVCAVGSSGAGCCPAATPNCCNNATCVNLQTDVNNCGACNNACTAPANATPQCNNGTCTFTCNTGFTLVGSSCCPDAMLCMNGATQVCGCAAGLLCCPGPGGVCTTLGTIQNCLACNDVCTAPANATPICTPTGCDFVCNAPLVRCGTACVNLQNDVNNCGSCGNVCPAGSICTAGTCFSATCPNQGGCGNLGTCGVSGNCVCFRSVENLGFCHLPQSCSGLQTCTSTLDCPLGMACVVTCCGAQAVCIQPCPPGNSPVVALPAGPTTARAQ